MLVAASILACDFAHLAQECQAVCQAGTDLLHIDVMDGHFVPNLSMGPDIVRSIQKYSNKALDIHLMVNHPEFFVDLFLPLKPKFLSFHLEACVHIHRLAEHIKSHNVKVGLVLNPATNINLLEDILPNLDMVLLMSVNPGFGGQGFIQNTITKVQHLKAMIHAKKLSTIIAVDGGVDTSNISALKSAGLDLAVAGSSIFKTKDYKKAITQLRV